MRKVSAVSALLLSAAMAAPALAQSPASNKAFFASTREGIAFAPVNGAGFSDPVTLFFVPAAVKTSNGGALSATLSMEAALWTLNITTAIVNSGGKSSSSSRAAIKAWIEVDGVKMEPGKVVYADRLQATGVTLALTCTVPGTSCVVNGSLVLELFQATKNANAFTFFIGPLPPTIHTVEVKAQALIECRGSGGEIITCPTSTLAGYVNASTQAAIGKATLLVEEQQNWGKQ